MSKYDPQKHHRRSIRLKDYDYSQSGAYFVTICLHNEKQHLFGEIADGEMQLSSYGRIIQECWDAIPMHFPTVELDAFVIMPNHLHGIILIVNDGTTHASPVPNTRHSNTRPHGPKRGSLDAIVGSFKSAASKHINRLRDSPGAKIWHRNYYETVMRHERMLNARRQYIESNPANWEFDEHNIA